MAEFVLEEVPQFIAIPDGEILQAVVEKCDVREANFEDRKTGQKAKRVSFGFQITEPGDHEGRFVWGETPTTFSSHPDCKLRVWVQELLGEDELPVGFKFNTDVLIGLSCRAVIGQRSRKAADGSEVQSNFVSDVIRSSTVKQANDLF